MHFPGHSFAQKRKSTKRPRDLHIRKVSFSGSSLSGSSLSSSCSTASACTAIPYNSVTSPYRRESTQESPISPPPRLHERPFKERKPPATFYFGDDEVDEDDDEDKHVVEVEGTQFHMELPPHTSPMDHHAQEPTDYFWGYVKSRPAMPRSRWSESTIQSVEQHDSRPDSMHDDYAVETVVVEPPNFSYKRNTVTAESTRRPPMRAMDSVEELVKKGGWKRRGVVFDQQEEDEGFAL